MPEANWLQFTAHQPKRNRADLVCVVCHSKTVKCDLQVRSAQGHNNCTSCAAASRECRFRPSKRDKNRRTAKGQAVRPLTSPYDAAGRHPNATFPVEFSATNVVSVLDDSQVPVHPGPIVATQSVNNLSRFGSGTIYQPQGVATEDTEMIALQSPRQSQIRVLPGSSNNLPAHQSPTDKDHAETTETTVDDVDTGFLQVWGPENKHEAETHVLHASREPKRVPDSLQPDLLQSYVETYFEYCYAWCPVLDRATLLSDLIKSPLLSNALALVGSHIQPPIVPHDRPATYYERARKMFYNDEEADAMTSLRAVSLFYWWNPRSFVTLHRDSSWWWTSVVIRHAQQLDIHREPGPDHSRWAEVDMSLRRRIWWTAFARERLTGLCHSKPCVIDPEDCNISEPTLADFPSNPQDQAKGEIFIYWVRLCAIIGRVAKHLSRSGNSSSTSPFPVHLGKELIQWNRSLPPHLHLCINSDRTTSFNRDVHQLYLPYLTVIIILHLKRSSQTLPEALPPGILAASCIARILKDVLARGNTRFLMAMTCWYCATAFTALLQACRIEKLSEAANEELNILTITAKQLVKMWPTANIMNRGFERLRKTSSTATAAATGGNELCNLNPPYGNRHSRSPSQSAPAISRSGTVNSSMMDNGGIDWKDYFPFATPDTSRIAEKLLKDMEHGRRAEELFFLEDETFDESTVLQLEDFYGLFEDDSLMSWS